MTLQFPSDPINGAVSGDYTYDADKGAWRKNAALPVSVTHSDVAPSNPREGDQWWKSDEGTLFTYYNDGSSSQWVESTNVVANVEPNPIPAGAMMAWGSDTIPSNWLLCDGSAISRSTYASLFAAIGTQYGSGDGTTTFNLPDVKGRTIVGKDSSQTEFDVLGETGGSKTHVLTQSQMPSHTHTFSGTTSGESGHTHSVVGLRINDGGAGIQLVAQSDGNLVIYSGGAAQGFGGRALSGNFREWSIGNASESEQTTGSSGHTHTYSGTTSSSGSGEAHNNLQPYISLNYIIKFSAGETPGDSQLAVRVGTLETQNNATPLSQNYIINGAFDVWQRGTSFTNLSLYGADRWRSTINSSSPSLNVSRVSGPLGSIKYAARYTQTTSQASVVEYAARQFMETQHISSIAEKIATISFWYRSNKVGTHSVRVSSETRATGGTNINTPFTVNTADVWERYSVLVTSFEAITAWTAADNDWGAYVDIGFRTGNAFGFTSLNANDYFEITGVQLEEGSFATPFRRNAPSIQAELAACQRYYEKSYSTATSPGTVTEDGVHRHSGSGNGSGRHYVPIRFKVEKRTNGYTVDTYNPTAAGAAWITQNSAQAGLARTPLVENKSTSGMVLNVEDGGYAWAVGNTRGHWAVSDEL